MNVVTSVDGHLSQPIRYVLIGGLNTAFGYGLFALCYVTLDGHIPYAAILALAHVFAVTFSFATQRRWVFVGKSTAPFRGTAMAWLRFQFAYIGLLILGLVVNAVMLKWVVSSPWLAQLAAMAVGVCLGYFVHRHFVFRAKE